MPIKFSLFVFFSFWLLLALVNVAFPSFSHLYTGSNNCSIVFHLGTHFLGDCEL